MDWLLYDRDLHHERVKQLLHVINKFHQIFMLKVRSCSFEHILQKRFRKKSFLNVLVKPISLDKYKLNLTRAYLAHVKF